MGAVRRFARRLRFPQLLLLVAVLFAVDLVAWDPIPFLDEILLALLTLILAVLRDGDGGEEEGGDSEDGQRPIKNVTPSSGEADGQSS